jgi:hypothetical protein
MRFYIKAIGVLAISVFWVGCANKLNELSNLSNIPTVNTFRDRVDSSVIFEYSLNSDFKGYYKLDSNIGEQYNIITQNL